MNTEKATSYKLKVARKSDPSDWSDMSNLFSTFNSQLLHNLRSLRIGEDWCVAF
jgi:hypothetical protein